MAYRASDTPDRMKAIGGVLMVHAALAVLILSGLNIKSVTHTVDQLKTFDIQLPPLPPPPRQVSERARDRAGAPSRKASPTPVVAPPPKIAIQTPLTTAPARSTGSAATAGGGTAGDGTGAGGLGSGPGGGGAGDYSGYTPARMLNKIPDHQYRRIASGRIPWGSAAIRFRVNVHGTMTNCRIVRSSGDPIVDAVVCDAATRYLRFTPARNRAGRPIEQDMSYTPTWRPNY